MSSLTDTPPHNQPFLSTTDDRFSGTSQPAAYSWYHSSYRRDCACCVPGRAAAEYHLLVGQDPVGSGDKRGDHHQGVSASCEWTTSRSVRPMRPSSFSQPPATFVIPPSLLPATVNPPSEPSSPATSTFGRGTHNRSPAASAAGSKTAPATSLIERYGLSSRVSSRKGKEVDEGEHGAAPPVPDSASSAAAAATPGPLGGGKGKWEDTREGREKGLKERKERMILEARR